MCFNDIKGQIKVKLKYKDNKFFVNCLQCRNLVSKKYKNQIFDILKFLLFDSTNLLEATEQSTSFNSKTIC